MQSVLHLSFEGKASSSQMIVDVAVANERINEGDRGSTALLEVRRRTSAQSWSAPPAARLKSRRKLHGAESKRDIF